MKRGRYDFFSPKNKAKVAKYAAENSVTASLHHFKQTGEFNNLKESTVRGWVKQYRSELRPAAGESSTGTACVKKLAEDLWSAVSNQLSNNLILHLCMYKKCTNARNVPRYMPNNIVIALHCHCEYIVSISQFSYTSQGFSKCCIPQIFIHVISTNATIKNK